jgi:hypothetical protein
MVTHEANTARMMPPAIAAHHSLAFEKADIFRRIVALAVE